MKLFTLVTELLSCFSCVTAVYQTFDHVPLNQYNNIIKIICGENEYYNNYWLSSLKNYQEIAASSNFRYTSPFYPKPNDFKAQGPYQLLWLDTNFVSYTEPDSGDRLVLDKDLKITGAVTILKFETEGENAGHHAYRKCAVTIKGS